MSSGYKKCPNGHFYQGDTCPYCPTQYYSVNEVNPFDGVGDLQQHIEELMTIPVCPHCGRSLRKGIPRPEHCIVVSSLFDIRDRVVPWNYKWDGKCEHCGHDFNIAMHINMGSTGPDNRERQTYVRVSAAGFNHHLLSLNPGEFGTNTVLSGVEINNKDGRVFLSTNELKYLIKMLQNSPILKQFDYYEEDVMINMVRT